MPASRLLLLACALLSLGGTARAASDLAFVWWGEPDPTGVDQAFLALARRRGAAALRETPGHLATEPLSAQLSDALTLAQGLDFKGAIAGFDAVERAAVAHGGGTLSGGELTDLYAYRAGAYTALGDEADAWDDLVQAAALAPARPLDPARFPPRLVEAARRARESLGAPLTLRVEPRPADALVIVDGQLEGRGRVELTLPPGRHFVRLERAGFVPSGRVIDLAGAPATVRVTLSAAPSPTAAALARRGAQAGARRTLGGWIGGGEQATVQLVLVGADGVVQGRRALGAGAELTSGGLAAAVDALVAAAAAHGPVEAPATPWYRRPLVWSLVGGAAAVALGVGLGVGLSTHDSGVPTRVDLGPGR